MRKKPRNALVSNDNSSFIDLGEINMTPTNMVPQDNLESELEKDAVEFLDPTLWTERNKIIVRHSQAL